MNTVYASDSGDYFFNIPAYGSAQLYFEDDFEFESGKLYRFRVAAGGRPCFTSLWLPKRLISNGRSTTLVSLVSRSSMPKKRIVV